MICGVLATQPYVPSSSGEQAWHPASTSLQWRSCFAVKEGKSLWPLLALQNKNWEETDITSCLYFLLSSGFAVLWFALTSALPHQGAWDSPKRGSAWCFQGPQVGLHGGRKSGSENEGLGFGKGWSGESAPTLLSFESFQLIHSMERAFGLSWDNYYSRETLQCGQITLAFSSSRSSSNLTSSMTPS